MKLEWNEVTIDLDRKTGRLIGLDEYDRIEPRFVYVIQTPLSLPIEYENNKVSRVCYIGKSAREDTKRSRIASHAHVWISKCLALNPRMGPFFISYCNPRRKNFVTAYEDIEAYMIRVFEEKFGTTPLFNKRSEPESGDYDVDLNTNLFRSIRRPGVLKSFDMSDDAAIEE